MFMMVEMIRRVRFIGLGEIYKLDNKYLNNWIRKFRDLILNFNVERDFRGNLGKFFYYMVEEIDL